MPRHDALLVRRDDGDGDAGFFCGDVGCVGLVFARVGLDAEEAQGGADVAADVGVVFADAAGECEGVDSADVACQRGGVSGGGFAKDGEGEFCVGGFALAKLAHVGGDAGKAEEAALAV